MKTRIFMLLAFLVFGFAAVAEDLPADALLRVAGVGSLAVHFSHPGEPVYAPYAMTIEIRCKGHETVTYPPEALCAVDNAESDSARGSLRLHYVLPDLKHGPAKCEDKGTAEDLDLRELCASL